MAWAKFFRKPGGNLAKSYQPGSMLSLAPTKGLLNEPGQNNCFLNSAVQVLWHLDIFRRSLRQLPGHFCLGDPCIFCELKGIFREFQSSRERALTSDNLRYAMAETFKDEQRFQLGDMDDAAECFEEILEKIHLAIVGEDTDACTSKSCITHQKFALMLYEQVVCHSCGASSDPLPSIELVHYVYTTALCEQNHGHRKEKSFGELLQAANAVGDSRNCKNCNQKNKIRRVLMNSPEIVTIGLVWDDEYSEDSDEVIHCMGPLLSLSALFYRVTDEHARKQELLLVGMICFSNRHYCAFAFHTKSAKWVLFDDATVKEIGSRWKDVVSKCIKGHFQPVLLFYANPDGSAITVDDASRQKSNQSHFKTPVNGEVQGIESPVSSTKKLELTRENLNALFSQELFKQKTPSTLSRGSGMTSGGRASREAKTVTSNPKNRLKEIPREVAQKAREMQANHLPRRDPDRTGHHRPESRSRDTGEDRTYSRSASPPKNGFNMHLESRLYNSQGKGPIRAERVPQFGHSSHETLRSHSRLPVLPSVPSGHHRRRIDPVFNGYDTDSSQDSRGHSGNSRSRPSRPWKPMREALNVDSVIRHAGDENSGSQERRQHSPRRRPNSHSPSRDRERLRDQTRGGRDDRKPKSLMTIYEDEQRSEMGGSRSSLESSGRGVYSDKDRSKGTTTLKVRNDNWTIQRTESGYESSDRLSNGSANLDSPVVENLSSKDLRPIPELHLMRDPIPRRRSKDFKGDVLYSTFSAREEGRTSPDLLDSNSLSGVPMHRTRAVRYKHGILEKNDALDSEQEENVGGTPVSPGPPYLAKTSSSEWNSSDDLAGPLSEQDEAATTHIDHFTHKYPPPLPPKTLGNSHTELSGIPSLLPEFLIRTSPHNHPKNGVSPLSHTTLRRWIETPAEHRLSSDASSKSGSSDQDRNDLSASESEERFPSPNPKHDGTDSERVLPTTYFSVDNCMTDTYRAKYHRRPALIIRTEDHTSSGESDLEGKGLPLPDVQPLEPSKSRAESAFSTAKTVAKWNPVTPKTLDEHGFL
ncbi:LOW QUALITY PROTEIN: inactive ubiquitin carboxyl-terminal hydrolase 53 [Pholidichthys leucotaenia]